MFPNVYVALVVAKLLDEELLTTCTQQEWQRGVKVVRKDLVKATQVMRKVFSFYHAGSKFSEPHHQYANILSSS